MSAGVWGSSSAPLPAGWAPGQLAALLELVPAFFFGLPPAPDGWSPRGSTPLRRSGRAWVWMRVSVRELEAGDTAPAAPHGAPDWSGRVLVDELGAPDVRVSSGSAVITVRAGGWGAVAGVTTTNANPVGKAVSWLPGRVQIPNSVFAGESLYVSVGTTGEGTAGSALVDGLGIEFLPPVGPRPPLLTAPAAGEEINAAAAAPFAWQHRPSRAGGRQGGWGWRISSPGGLLYWSADTGALTSVDTENPGAVSGFELPPGALSGLDTARGWQARTQEAQDGRWSPWSSERSVTPVSPPSLTVTVSSPHGDLSPTITGAPVITRPSSVVTASQWQVRDNVSGAVIWDTGVTAGARVVHEAPSTTPWVNEASVRAWGRIRQTGGAWSNWVPSAPFVVSWTAPPTPVVSIDLDALVHDDPGVPVLIENLAPGREVTVWSSIDDGLTWMLTQTFTAEGAAARIMDATVGAGETARWSAVQYDVVDGVRLASERGVSDTYTPAVSSAILASAYSPATTWLRVRVRRRDPVRWPRPVAVRRILDERYAAVFRGIEGKREGAFLVLSRTAADREALHRLLQCTDPLILRANPEELWAQSGFRPGERITLHVVSEHSEGELTAKPWEPREIPVSWVEARTPEIGEAPASAPITRPVAHAHWVEVARNLARNPWASPTGATTEWKPRFGLAHSWVSGTGPFGPGTFGQLTQVTSAATGGRCYDVGGNMDLAPGTSGDWVAYPVVAGVPVEVSAWVRSNRSVHAGIAVRLHDGAGAWQGAYSAGPVVLVAGWVRVAHTVTPAQDGYLVARVDNAPIAWANGDVWHQTAVKVGTPGVDFDGDHLPAGYTAPDYRTRWLGPAGASPSVLEQIEI